MPTSDLSSLSDPQLGMMMVTNAEIFAHFEATHSVLNKDDVVFDLPPIITTEATNSLLRYSRRDCMHFWPQLDKP